MMSASPKDVIVVDLDGTLANIKHRLHLIQGEKKDFDSFYLSLGGDTPNLWCKAIMDMFWAHGYDVVIVSARRKSCDGPTRRWLEEHDIKYNDLILTRPEGDHTPDTELKKAWLHGFEGRDRILFVLDDRTKVVDMWRAEGLTCLQCARWPETGGGGTDGAGGAGAL